MGQTIIGFVWLGFLIWFACWIYKRIRTPEKTTVDEVVFSKEEVTLADKSSKLFDLKKKDTTLGAEVEITSEMVETLKSVVESTEKISELDKKL